MCGINGFNWYDKNLIQKMNEIMKHRGPDNEEYFADQENNISLGHTRLSIIDLSDKGNQPMSNIDKSLWIVYNGETYNYKNLREKLKKKGQKFISRTDCEVILHSFSKYAEESFKLFNGIFAFCIYDVVNKCLYLVRDRLGIKPLYYYFDGNKFIFSSEIKSFQIFNFVPFNIDKNSINEYLFTMNVSNESFFKNINSVKPGHFLKFDILKNRLSIHKYFDIHKLISKKKFQHNISRNEKHLVDYLDNLLNEVVKNQLVADIPVGALCSGGIDSSLITAIAKKYVNNLKIFSVSVTEKGYNEQHYAEKVASYLRLNLITEELDRKKFLKNYEKCIYINDLPFTHPNSVGIYLMSKKAKDEGIRVLLSGEGADELFGGYPQYKQYYLKLLIEKIPLYSKLLNKYKYILSTSNYTKYLLEDGNIIIDNYHNAPWIENRHFSFQSFIRDYNFLTNTLEQKLLAYMAKDLNYYLIPILRRADRMPMASGVEMRVPFLDNKLLDFAINLPLKHKVGIFKSKYLLKKVAERYLPKEVVYRKKMGFSLPTEKWLNVKDVRKNMLKTWKEQFMIEKSFY